MNNSYLLYTLSLLSAFTVYWALAVLGTVAASYSLIYPLSLFVCIVHFGVSSWLFLYWPKFGRLLSIVTALGVCFWPIGMSIEEFKQHQIQYAVFALALTIPSLVTIYLHSKTFNRVQNHIPNLAKGILSLMPFGLSLYALYFLLF